jgi:hypothetical protein
MREDEQAPNEHTIVEGADLAEWLGLTVPEVENLVAEGVLKRRDDGLFPLKLSVQTATAYWERQASGGGRLM